MAAILTESPELADLASLTLALIQTGQSSRLSEQSFSTISLALRHLTNGLATPTRPGLNKALADAREQYEQLDEKCEDAIAELNIARTKIQTLETKVVLAEEKLQVQQKERADSEKKLRAKANSRASALEAQIEELNRELTCVRDDLALARQEAADSAARPALFLPPPATPPPSDPLAPAAPAPLVLNEIPEYIEIKETVIALEEELANAAAQRKRLEDQLTDRVREARSHREILEEVRAVVQNHAADVTQENLPGILQTLLARLHDADAYASMQAFIRDVSNLMGKRFPRSERGVAKQLERVRNFVSQVATLNPEEEPQCRALLSAVSHIKESPGEFASFSLLLTFNDRLQSVIVKRDEELQDACALLGFGSLERAELGPQLIAVTRQLMQWAREMEILLKCHFKITDVPTPPLEVIDGFLKRVKKLLNRLDTKVVRPYFSETSVLKVPAFVSQTITELAEETKRSLTASRIEADDAANKQNETIRSLQEELQQSKGEITGLQAQLAELSEERDSIQRGIGPANDLRKIFADVMLQKKSLEEAVVVVQREKDALNRLLKEKTASAKKRFEAAMQAERGRAHEEVAILKKRIEDYERALSGRKVKESGSPGMSAQGKKMIQTLRFEKQFLARFARIEVEEEGPKIRPLIASVMFLLQLRRLVPGRGN
jgi:DNA repair exonuclease SbcCD ATPase subunit